MRQSTWRWDIEINHFSISLGALSRHFCTWFLFRGGWVCWEWNVALRALLTRLHWLIEQFLKCGRVSRCQFCLSWWESCKSPLRVQRGHSVSRKRHHHTASLGCGSSLVTVSDHSGGVIRWAHKSCVPDCFPRRQLACKISLLIQASPRDASYL